MRPHQASSPAQFSPSLPFESFQKVFFRGTRSQIRTRAVAEVHRPKIDTVFTHSLLEGRLKFPSIGASQSNEFATGLCQKAVPGSQSVIRTRFPPQGQQLSLRSQDSSITRENLYFERSFRDDSLIQETPPSPGFAIDQRVVSRRPGERRAVRQILAQRDRLAVHDRSSRAGGAPGSHQFGAALADDIAAHPVSRSRFQRRQSIRPARAETSSRRQKVDSFENRGLAGAVLAHQNVPTSSGSPADRAPSRQRKSANEIPWSSYSPDSRFASA